MNSSQRRKVKRQIVRDFPIGTMIEHRYNQWRKGAKVVDHNSAYKSYWAEMMITEHGSDYAFWVKASNWRKV